jgi:amino acid transporter
LSKSKTFVREATGLVREASWFDVFMYNEAGMSFAGCMIMTSMFADILLGGDFFTAWLVSTIMGVLIGLTYYLLSVTMPRTGADYIYDSRILHPAVGLVAAGFVGWMAALVNIGYGATGWILYALVPFLSIMSLTTNNAALGNLAVAASSSNLAFVIACISTVIWGVIIGVGGLRRYLVIQNVLVVICLIATAVMLGVTLTTPHSAFVASFDAVAKGYNTTYSGIISNASQAGWTPTPTTPYQALFFVPMVLSGSWWATQSACFAGEIKNIRKSQLVGMLASILLMSTVFFVAYASLTSMVGYNFANAMAWFGFNNPSAITIPVLLPYPTVFYYGLVTNNVVLTVIIAVGGMLSIMMFIPWGILIFSRYLFAMSFDRVLPEAVSKINERFHTPVNSVLMATVLAMVIMGLEQWLTTFPASQAGWIQSWIYYVGITANVLVQVAAFISAIALALLPYVRRELYEQAFPFKRKIVGIPVATWSGLLTICILIFSLDVWFLQPPWSTLIYGGFPQLAYLCVAFGIIMVFVYFALKAYRARQGLDLSLVFKEIPPE